MPLCVRCGHAGGRSRVVRRFETPSVERWWHVQGAQILPLWFWRCRTDQSRWRTLCMTCVPKPNPSRIVMRCAYLPKHLVCRFTSPRFGFVKMQEMSSQTREGPGIRRWNTSLAIEGSRSLRQPTMPRISWRRFCCDLREGRGFVECAGLRHADRLERSVWFVHYSNRPGSRRGHSAMLVDMRGVKTRRMRIFRGHGPIFDTR